MNKVKAKIGVLCFLLAGLVSVLYGQFLWNPIVFDDVPFFYVDDGGDQPVSSLRFAWFELRSLPYATLAWTKALWGLDLIHFRIGNLLLHASVVVALFAFLSRLFVVVGHDALKDSLSPQWLAFFAALLFALHPVATYAVGYLVQRTIVMATLFSLLALWTYLQGSVLQSRIWMWATVPCYFLAVYSKEHAIMLPAVLGFLTVLLHADWWVKIKQRWALFVALTMIAFLVLLTRKSLFGAVYEVHAAEMLIHTAADVDTTHLLSVITQMCLFFKYVFLWMVPNPAWMSIDMREPFAQSFLSLFFLAAVAYIGWGGAALWLLLKRGLRGLVGFSMLFPWIMFFTELYSVRIQEVFVLYRSYLWMPGIFCFVPVVFSQLSQRRATMALAGLALIFFPLSMERLLTMSNSYVLWDDAHKLLKGRIDLPGAKRIYYNRGSELIRIGRLYEGVKDLKQAIAIDKDFVEAYVNLGAAYFKDGDWNNAINSWNKASEMYAGHGKNLQTLFIYQRANAYEKIGELPKALADYSLSCIRENMGCDGVLRVHPSTSN